MNLNIYEKTRYQNIYRHKKNKNYIVKINTPVDSTISRINGEKILKLEEALKIRDNSKNKLQKEKEAKFKNDFDSVWEKYIYSCKYEKKLSYNTCHKKEELYNAFFKGKFNKPLPKISKDILISVIENFKTTDRQKNELIVILKAFFNWCQKEEYILYNPIVFEPLEDLVFFNCLIISFSFLFKNFNTSSLNACLPNFLTNKSINSFSFPKSTTLSYKDVSISPSSYKSSKSLAFLNFNLRSVESVIIIILPLV